MNNRIEKANTNSKKKDLFNFDHRWKLLDWIDESKLDWHDLAVNENAMYLLEQYIDDCKEGYATGKKCKFNLERLSLNPSAIYWLEKNKKYINWSSLSYNRSAIHLLEKNKNKINWKGLSYNPAAIHLLERRKNRRKIDWEGLSENPAAIHLLEKNKQNIRWYSLSKNPSAIHLLEKNPDKIDWTWIFYNTSAKHIIEQNMHNSSSTTAYTWNTWNEVDWTALCMNESKWAIDIIKQNQDKIQWWSLSFNPFIFELDYDFFYRRMDIIRKELIQKTWHPNRVQQWCLSIDELNDLS